MLEECAALLMRGSQEGEDQSSHTATVQSVTQVRYLLGGVSCQADTS